MEYLSSYFMSALPVLIAFVGIWWLLTIYVLVSSYRSASRVNEDRSAPGGAEGTGHGSSAAGTSQGRLETCFRAGASEPACEYGRPWQPFWVFTGRMAPFHSPPAERHGGPYLYRVRLQQ